MSRSEKPCAVLLVAASSLLVSQFAFADAPATPSPQPSDAALEAAAPPADAHCVPAWVIDAAGIRQLPERCVDNSATTEIGVSDPDSRCDPPWFIDAKGIRRARQECLRDPAQVAPAAPPGGVTGKSSPAPAASGSQPDACEQPDWVDQHGIKRLKMQCLGPETAAVPAPDGSTQNTEEAENCAQHYWVDQHGIKRLKMRCLGPSTSAAPVPALPSVTPGPSSHRKQTAHCTEPFWVDQHGIKRMKMQCL